jgi:hypothetical protein
MTLSSKIMWTVAYFCVSTQKYIPLAFGVDNPTIVAFKDCVTRWVLGLPLFIAKPDLFITTQGAMLDYLVQRWGTSIEAFDGFQMKFLNWCTKFSGWGYYTPGYYLFLNQEKPQTLPFDPQAEM